MRLGNEDAFIEIELGEDQFFTDRAISVSAFCDGFGGKVENVYISAEAANVFISELEALARNEADHVQLKNMSSDTSLDPFQFLIAKVDELGHLTARAILTKPAVRYGGSSVLSSTVEIEIDREYLSELILSFHRLFAS
jgi:hypothetical protein